MATETSQSVRVDGPTPEVPSEVEKPCRPGGPLKHICRLISFMDGLYYLGDFLYKRSLRYSGATFAVCLVGYLGNYLPGVHTYNARVAIVLPLVVGGATLIGGLILKNIPNLFFRRLTNVAQASDLDLMEDYRKSQQDEHLEALWQRVFRHEWAIGSDATRVHPHPLECPPHVISDADAPEDPLAKARYQFLRRAVFALERDQSQPRQRFHLGIDLRFMEDWRNGGYFDRNDVKLIEEFDGSATIDAVKAEVGYGQAGQLHDLPGRLAQKFWTTLITRAIGVQVGEAVTWLNRTHDTDYFNAQALLWPREEDEDWLTSFPQGRDDVLHRRRMLLDRVFGEDARDAQRMLERMALPSFLFATQLRARFDPEYVDGSLGYTPVGDLEAVGAEPWRIEPYPHQARRAADDGPRLLEFVGTYRRELLLPQHAEALRSVRVAMHVDRCGLRRRLKALSKNPASRSRLEGQITAIIDEVVQKKVWISRLLVGIRVHHELTRLHHQGYVELLKTLRRSCRDQIHLTPPPPVGLRRTEAAARA